MAGNKTPLQVMQRRAKAKIRRLKAKGASAESLAGAPVLSWEQVQQLTPSQRGGYFQKLRSFTSTRSHVLATGTVIKESEFKRAKASLPDVIRAGNRKAQSEARRIDAIRIPNVPGADSFTTIKQRQLEKKIERPGKKGRYHLRGTVYGMLADLDVPEDIPQSAVERRAEAAAARLYTTMAERRRTLRDSVIEMLLRIGDEDGADIVRSLSDDAFDVLTQRSTFVDELSAAYAPEAGTKAEGKSVKQAAQDYANRTSPTKGSYRDLLDVMLQMDTGTVFRGE